MAMFTSGDGTMLSELNERAWRVSTYAMIKTGRRWEVCTTGKIRELYEQVSREGGHFVPAITSIVHEYTPPKNKKRNERAFKAFGAKLLKELKGLKSADAKQLLEYVLWDIRELEQLFKANKENELRTNLKRRFTAEGMNDMTIVDEIVRYWKKENTYKKFR